MGPYADTAAPTVAQVAFVPERGGGIAIVANAYDMPAPRVPGAWADEPVTPVLLRWRVRPGAGWRTAVDFREQMLDAHDYSGVYAPGTRQNHMGLPGLYCFYVDRG